MKVSFFKKLDLWHWAVLFCVAILATTTKYASTGCLEEMRVNGVIKFSYNCDSPRLVNYMGRPGEYFEEFHNWKGRPVYFAYGLIVGQAILAPVTAIKPLIHIDGALPRNKDSHIHRTLHTYLAYFALNIAVIFLSCWAAIRLVGLALSGTAAASLALVLASSDIVEGGVLVLHTVIMNMGVAIGAALFCLLGCQIRLLRVRTILGLGASIGILTLVYPAFIIWTPAFLVGLLYAYLVMKPDLGARKLGAWKLGSVVGLIALSFTATLIWTNLNTYVFGSSTYLTAQYGQFSWLPNAIANGEVFSEVALYTQTFLSTVWRHTYLELCLALAVLGVVVIASLYRHHRIKLSFSDPASFAILVALLGVLSFNYLQGYYAPRMHYCYVLLVYMLVARIALTNRQTHVLSLSFLVVAALHFYDAFATFTDTGN